MKVFCVCCLVPFEKAELLGGRGHGGKPNGGHTEDAPVLLFAACALITVTSCDLRAAGLAHQS